MTKHFCDKCGKECGDFWLVQFGKIPGHPAVQHVPNETMEICSACKNVLMTPDSGCPGVLARARA